MQLTGRQTTGIDRNSVSSLTAKDVIAGALNAQPVAGLTHGYYKYPARFSPPFARAVIKAFSSPGDIVLDPFMGGGTTLVEALAAGRHPVGCDISGLAAFLSTVKTTVLHDTDIRMLEDWLESLPDFLSVHRKINNGDVWARNGYRRNLNGKSTWRLRKLIGLGISWLSGLPSLRQRNFARCIILKTAQWALDGRKRIPSVVEFRSRLIEDSELMLSGAREFRETVLNRFGGCEEKIPTVHCLNRSAVGIEEHPVFKTVSVPKLVLMSPPYPGIRVLYHRWQVDGRKETPAPLWIANSPDGGGLSHYTMGYRSKNLDRYFSDISKTFRSLSLLVDSRCTVVQMMGFSDVKAQLPRYLGVMESCGFSEVDIPGPAESGDGRLWCEVPNRKWHAHRKGNTPGSREVVLIHRKMS